MSGGGRERILRNQQLCASRTSASAYEHGSWWPWRVEVRGRCVDNAPRNTGCNRTGEDRCYTYGCGGPTGGSGNDDEQ